MAQYKQPENSRRFFRSFFARNSASHGEEDDKEDDNIEVEKRPTKWSMGVLNDPITHEVPGSVLLLTGHRNQPLGLRHVPARNSISSLPQLPPTSRQPSLHERTPTQDPKKTTADGAIILDPQPDDSRNDPLNWPTLRRDSALLSLGLYCMVGGGMTPILAAGFTNVASTYHVTVPEVALTTGLYMMGLGVGSVFASPTAILFGKRPVYLVSSIIFTITAIWCAVSPTYHSLLIARVFMGISVSPVECLPSATIAEIFFLHERAYRLGIYTLLLLGGKNLVPLVSAAIIQAMDWRWVFWIVAMVSGFCGCLLFLFVPESFWDRTPKPKIRGPSRVASRLGSIFSHYKSSHAPFSGSQGHIETGSDAPLQRPALAQHTTDRNHHVGFAPSDRIEEDDVEKMRENSDKVPELVMPDGLSLPSPPSPTQSQPAGHNNLDTQMEISPIESQNIHITHDDTHETPYLNHDGLTSFHSLPLHTLSARYTHGLRESPKLTFAQHLKPFRGRLTQDKWIRVAIRPFILFCYPAVLWSAGVYACAVGWLIVLSESVSVVYRTKDTYNFSALSTGLIYISPFIGGVLGTAVAGKVSDIIVRAMSKRNGGLYEPEFRLVMAIPITIATVIGLMGFGWSAQERDAWIVPTIFFGIISFGCSLASTTSITFCVDSYRQYAGEALVTLNFSKNIFHGLVFSLFFTKWLEADGSKSVFIWLGVIQLVLMAFTIPMYIFGKRARMWTVRKNLMEKF